MKQTRLLEIIREEIAGALNELSNVLVTNVKGKTTTMPFNTPDEKMVVTKLKQDGNIKNIETTSGVNIKEEEIEEDNLNEMAYNIVLAQPNELTKLQAKIKDSTKKGEQLLAKVIEIIQRDKKEGKPIRQRDISNELGIIQQKVNPLINILMDYGILEKGESVTGVTKKKVTDKSQGRPAGEPKEEKPTSTGKKGRPAGEPKAEKTATLTPGDDGFDDVSYSDDEESAEAAKAAGSDETAKELGKAATRRDKVVKAYQMIAPELKDKIAKAKEGDKEAMNWLKERTPIIKAYEKAKQVKI